VELITRKTSFNSLAAMTGNQRHAAVFRASSDLPLGLAVVAADSNTASSMYPDQSLYSCPTQHLKLAKRITALCSRADQIEYR